MKRKVVLVEISQIADVFPLASAYLRNYALAHGAASGDVDFVIRPLHVDNSLNAMVSSLVAEAADVYTFSCYCWNMRRVLQVLEALRVARPRARFILGGAQVLTAAQQYFRPTDENVFVCNGEGEHTFQAFLDVDSTTLPDYATVPGLSFFRDGQLVTTSPAPQVDLDSIPSPFLSGPFDESILFSHYLWETNRGCPFHCTFCLWGQLQDSLAKFDLQRLKEEITWMARRQYIGLHICDANWGILDRDLELTEHIARCKRDFGVPFIIIATHIKNQPERVLAIAQVLAREGIRGTTSTALQSLNPTTLATIKRKNRSDRNLVLFEDALAESELGSYAELIWPLPDETLCTLTAGLARLAELRAASVLCYPLMLLNNTEMSAQREAHGFVTAWDTSDVKEIEWVLATKQVSQEECRQGFWLYLGFHLLYNARALYYTMHYVVGAGEDGYGDLFQRFSLALQADQSPIGRFCRRIVVDRNPSLDGPVYGLLLDQVLHSHRGEFSQLLAEFCSRQSWWSDDRARTLFQLDCLARPIPFANQLLTDSQEPILVATRERAFVVSLPEDVHAWLRENLEVGELTKGFEAAVVIDHERNQFPRMAQKSMEQQGYYLHSLLNDLRSTVPRIVSSDDH
jgi:hypothetical protein